MQRGCFKEELPGPPQEEQSRIRYQDVLSKVIFIQSRVRAYIQQSRYHQMKKAARTIESAWRARQERKKSAEICCLVVRPQLVIDKRKARPTLPPRVVFPQWKIDLVKSYFEK